MTDKGVGEGASPFKPPELLVLAVILFPGFLSIRVAEYFAFSPKLEDEQLIASAFAATLLNLGIVFLFPRWFKKWLGWVEDYANTSYMVTRPSFLVVLSLVAVATGLLWAVVDSKGYLFDFRFTDRVSRSDVWEIAFSVNARTDPPWYVRVVTEAGEVFHGIPEFYSEGTEERSLVIAAARREVLKEAKPVMGAVPEMVDVECIPVGATAMDGKVLLLKEQIRRIEFIAPAAKTQARKKARKADPKDENIKWTYQCPARVPRSDRERAQSEKKAIDKAK